MDRKTFTSRSVRTTPILLSHFNTHNQRPSPTVSNPIFQIPKDISFLLVGHVSIVCIQYLSQPFGNIRYFGQVQVHPSSSTLFFLQHQLVGSPFLSLSDH